MLNRILFWGVVLLTAILQPVFVTAAEEEYKPLSFTTHTLKTGPLTLSWEPMPVVDENRVYTAKYSIANEADSAISCKISVRSIDTVVGIDKDKEVETVSFSSVIPAKSKKDFEYNFKPLPGTYTAHYPLNLYVDFEFDGQKRRANAVRVIETKFPTLPKKENLLTVIKNGGVSLLDKPYIAYYNLKDRPIVFLGENWTGTNNESKTHLGKAIVDCGQARRAVASHPPYTPFGGTIAMDYKLVLPKAEKVSLDYGCAIRKSYEGEPLSDGVTFRFLAKKPGGTKKLLDEIHTDSKVWLDRSVDLSDYSGQEIVLTIEFNPGPKNNTVCDACFLSGLTIFASKNGAREKVVTESAKKSFDFKLVNGMTATVEPGPKGLLDAKYSIKDPKSGKEIAFTGFQLAIGGISVPDQFGMVQRSTLRQDVSGKLTQRMSILLDDELVSLAVCAYEKNGLFILEIPAGNPARIGEFSLNPMNVTAERAYFGHGYVIEKPKQDFQPGGGGHNLSTSHAGFDFENGLSLLLGTEAPPTRLQIRPDSKMYSFLVSGPTRLAILPTTKGAFDAAIQYRTICPWHSKPSAGVARKRGRLTFDIWGGTYADNSKILKKLFEYGVTDSLFVKHCWQRWGYDVRLPDIWDETSDVKVLPGLGTYEELVELVDTCIAQKVPFGYHDNYIDFYPDAEDFSYDYITFHESGQPRKAWINHGQGVQSYQWRPDRFRPFLDRNLAITKRLLPKMDACFVDVFLSANVFDYNTRDGQFHSRKETQHYWKDCFETIGSALAHKNEKGETETAITMSEASSDFLIGSIDGGDAQWLALSQKGRAWAMYCPCDGWARTPWFAAVNHTNFSRHGAGYPDRYLSLRNYGLHGILSDDYIGAEILGGLDLMVSLGEFYQGSIRKHYLAQHVVRSYADKEIVGFEFAKENGKQNIYRQIVTWSDGMKVYGNRGLGNWRLPDGTVLPYYGYYVTDKTGRALSGIICNPSNEKEIVEFSQRPDSFYVNGRGYAKQEIYPVTPRMTRSEVLENGKFKFDVEWQADAPLPKDLLCFAHVFEPYRGYGHKQKGWFAIGAIAPPVPTSKWGKESVHTFDGIAVAVPNDIPGGLYHIIVGLFDPKTNKRYPLMGEGGQGTCYSVAELRITRNGDKVSVKIDPIEMEEKRETFFRLLPNKSEYPFRGVVTPGAVSVTVSDSEWTILPIPVIEKFEVKLDEKTLGKKVKSISCAGENVPFVSKDGRIVFQVTAKDAKKYIVKF